MTCQIVTADDMCSSVLGHGCVSVCVRLCVCVSDREPKQLWGLCLASVQLLLLLLPPLPLYSQQLIHREKCHEEPDPTGMMCSLTCTTLPLALTEEAAGTYMGLRQRADNEDIMFCFFPLLYCGDSQMFLP